MKLLTQWAVTSSALILIVLAARFLLKDKLSARLRYALWGVVLLRLLAPFQVELPANAPLPVLASNLVPELPTALERPVSPNTAATFTQIPAERLEEKQPNGNPVFSFTAADLLDYNPENNSLYVYRGGFTLGDMAVSLWLVGVGVAGAVMLVSNLRFAHRLRRTRKTLEAADSPIPVYVAEDLPSPCLFGVFKPAVYVTPAAESPDTLRHVLAHELTHYAHFDHIWSLLRILTLALHWYNPLVWLAVGLSKGDGELACDEGAVARLGEAERIPYGRTLVDMVAARSLRPGDLLSCSTAMTGGKKSIQERVARLVRKPETVKAALFAVVAVVVLSAVFVFAGRGDNQILEAYRDTVTQANSVAFVSSPLSSVSSPTIIDDDSISQAKEILLDISPLKSGEKPDLTGLDSAPSVFLFGTYDNGTLMQQQYTLLSQDGHTYVLAWSSQQDGSTGYETLGYLPDNVCARLDELSRQQSRPEPVQPDLDPYRNTLTQEEIDRANEAFRTDMQLSDGGWGPSEISCFFTSSYDSPARIDLEEFLRYCPLAEEVNERTEREEYQTVIAASWWVEQAHNPDFLLPTPMWRYPREKVSALLERYTGVTIDQLDWGDMLYLEEYDSFYNFTSDYGPGFFTCAGGQAGGDTVILWSAPNGDGDRSELTLQKSGGSWLIQSFHTAYPR